MPAVGPREQGSPRVADSTQPAGNVVPAQTWAVEADVFVDGGGVMRLPQPADSGPIGDTQIPPSDALRVARTAKLLKALRSVKVEGKYRFSVEGTPDLRESLFSFFGRTYQALHTLRRSELGAIPQRVFAAEVGVPDDIRDLVLLETGLGAELDQRFSHPSHPPHIWGSSLGDQDLTAEQIHQILYESTSPWLRANDASVERFVNELGPVFRSSASIEELLEKTPAKAALLHLFARAREMGLDVVRLEEWPSHLLVAESHILAMRHVARTCGIPESAYQLAGGMRLSQCWTRFDEERLDAPFSEPLGTVRATPEEIGRWIDSKDERLYQLDDDSLVAFSAGLMNDRSGAERASSQRVVDLLVSTDGNTNDQVRALDLLDRVQATGRQIFHVDMIRDLLGGAAVDDVRIVNDRLARIGIRQGRIPPILSIVGHASEWLSPGRESPPPTSRSPLFQSIELPGSMFSGPHWAGFQTEMEAAEQEAIQRVSENDLRSWFGDSVGCNESVERLRWLLSKETAFGTKTGHRLLARLAELNVFGSPLIRDTARSLLNSFDWTAALEQEAGTQQLDYEYKRNDLATALRLASAVGLPWDQFIARNDGREIPVTEHPVFLRLVELGEGKKQSILEKHLERFSPSYEAPTGQRFTAISQLLESEKIFDLRELLALAVEGRKKGTLIPTFGEESNAENPDGSRELLSSWKNLHARQLLRELFVTDLPTSRFNERFGLKDLSGAQLELVLRDVMKDPTGDALLGIRARIRALHENPSVLWEELPKHRASIVDVALTRLQDEVISAQDREMILDFLCDKLKRGELPPVADGFAPDVHAHLQENWANRFRELANASVEASGKEEQERSVNALSDWAATGALHGFEVGGWLTEVFSDLHHLDLKQVAGLDEADQKLGRVDGALDWGGRFPNGETVSVAGIELPLSTAINKDRTAIPSEDEADLVMLPNTDSTTEKNLKGLVERWATGLPMGIEGSTATAKTSLVQYLCMKTQTPFRRVNCSSHTALDDFKGRYGIDVQGQPYSIKGLLQQAMENGECLLLDELNLADPAILDFLVPVLRGRPLVVRDENGRLKKIKLDPNFRLVATWNTEEYRGRRRLSAAQRASWMPISLEKLVQSDYEQILEVRYGNRIGIRERTNLIKVHLEMEKMAADQKGGIGKKEPVAYTVRDLIKVADRMVYYQGVSGLSPEQLLRREIEGVYLDRLWEQGDRANAERHVDVHLAKFEQQPLALEEDKELNLWRLGDVTIPKLGIQNAWVPTEEDTPFLLDQAFLRTLYKVAKAFEMGEHVTLIGEHGSRRQSVLEFYARLREQPLYSASLTADSDVSELIGSWTESGWQDEALTLALDRDAPGIFLCRDSNMADPGVQERLNSLTDGEGALVLVERDNRRIQKPPEMKIAYVINPPQEPNKGRQPRSPAARNRTTEIPVHEPTQEEVVAILRDESKRRMFSIETAVALAELHSRVKEGYQSVNGRPPVLGKRLGRGSRPALSLDLALNALKMAQKPGSMVQAYFDAAKNIYALGRDSQDNETIMAWAKEAFEQAHKRSLN